MTPWTGGSRPVTAQTFVTVKHRNGQVVAMQPAGAFGWTHAADFDPANPRHAGWWDIVEWEPFEAPDAQPAHSGTGA